VSKSNQSGAHVNPSGAEPWFVRAGPDFLNARKGRDCKGWPKLGDKHLVMLLILDWHARDKPFCFPSNAELAEWSGKTLRVIQAILEDLERLECVRRVMIPGEKDRRAGFVLLRRVDSLKPVADTPERLAEATAALLARGKVAAARVLKSAPSSTLKTAPSRVLKPAPGIRSLSLRRNLELDSERAEGSRINDNDSESVGPESTGDPLRSANPGLRESSASRNGKGSPASRDANPTDPADPAPGDSDRTAAGEGQSVSTDPSGEATAPVRADLIPDPALEPPAAPSKQPDTPTDIKAINSFGLSPERSAVLAALTPGKRAEVETMLSRGMETQDRRMLKMVYEELDRAAAGQRRRGPDPETAPLAELIAALPGSSDPTMRTAAAGRTAAGAGDHPGSWYNWEKMMGDVASGRLPAAEVLRILEHADNPANDVKKPAAYVSKSIKNLRRQLAEAARAANLA
jgi:hypothetical protein